MSLEPPALDDREYAAILEDARKRISVYADDWTDHNAHDPGITILETLAWLAETYGYQLDQVTDDHRLAYLGLLGESPRPPTAATATLRLDVPPALVGTELPEGVALTADDGSGAERGFETDHAVALTGASIARVVAAFPDGRTDNTAANGATGLSFLAFGPAATPGSRLYLGFAGDPFDAGPLDLHVDYHETDVPAPATHGDEDATFVPSVRVEWGFCTDYADWFADAAWTPVTVAHDDTGDLHGGGRIRLRAPDAATPGFDPAEWDGWRTDPGRLFEDEQPYRWLRAIVRAREPEGTEAGHTADFTPCEPASDPDSAVGPDRAWYDLSPRLDALRVNVVTASHRTTLTGGAPATLDPLRGGDGRGAGTTETSALPGQTFVFPTAPVLDAAVALRDPAAPDALVDWTPVASFDRAGPDETVYVLDEATGVVTFGDNVRGATPPPGAEVVAPEYAVGGGTAGNLSETAAWAVADDAFAALDVTPLGPATGGADAETVEEALVRLRRDLRVPYRAVTLDDYRAVATATPGLRFGRATAVVDPEPAEPGCGGHSRIRVAVVPYSERDRPEPSDGFLEAVTCHLRRHALLTDRVLVVPPTYVGVGVRAEIRVASGASPAGRTTAVAAALDGFLDPLTGYDGDGWPFGRPVYPSELYEVVAGVPGVDCAVDLSVTARGGSVAPDGTVAVGRAGLVYPTTHDVIVRTDRDTCGPGEGVA